MTTGLRKELIQLLGLRSDANQLLAPDGALQYAMNVWFARPGLIQKRRGISRFSTDLTFPVNKVFPYQNELLAMAGNALNRVQANGTVSQFSGSYPAPNAPTWRTRACVAGKNFLFNTDAEVYRLSGMSSQPVKAGGLIATNMTLALTGASGFLEDGKTVAYRYCIGSTDSFDRDIIGPVSGRHVVSNGAGGARDVIVTVNLPSTATEAHFIQVYRSESVTNGSQPDDDLKLVYEAQLKAAEIAAGSVSFTDIVPQALRGAYIYTAPNAGQGILQNNETPPYAAELTAHKDRVWYANTRRRAEFFLQVLAVGGTDGIQAGDTLRINGTAVTLTATAGAPGANQYQLITTGTAAYNIEQTALNIVAAINATTTTNTIVWARYISGPADVPGRILLFSRSVGQVSFNVFVGAGSKRDCFSPSMLPDSHSMNLSRTANVVTATVVAGTQSFKVGEQISVVGGTGTATFGNGPFTVATIDTVGPSTFITYAENGSNGTFGPTTVNVYGQEIAQFIQEAKGNRIYYSKADEFEAVPILNYVDVGRQDADIIACVSADDQLWVFKRDGIFRIVGDDETNFRVVEVDLTLSCNARETVTKFRGRPVALTNKGMVVCSTSGAEVFSWQIQVDILAKFVGANASLLEQLAYAVPYDSEEMLLLFFGDNLDTIAGTVLACNQGFIFNAKATEWTDWHWDVLNRAGYGKTCGVVNPADDKLYFGDRYDTSFGRTYLYQERKDRAASDYKDSLGDNSSVGIASLVAPVIQTAHSPGIEKLWQEVALLWAGTQPASVSLQDGNEWGLTAEGAHTIVPGSSYVSRVWPHADISRGTVLRLAISHATATEGFELSGIQVVYERLGPEGTR